MQSQLPGAEIENIQTVSIRPTKNYFEFLKSRPPNNRKLVLGKLRHGILCEHASVAHGRILLECGRISGIVEVKFL